MSRNRWFHCIEAVNGKIYAIGSLLGNNDWDSSVEEYDPQK
jgi:hypothetical protein